MYHNSELWRCLELVATDSRRNTLFQIEKIGITFFYCMGKNKLISNFVSSRCVNSSFFETAESSNLYLDLAE